MPLEILCHETGDNRNIKSKVFFDASRAAHRLYMYEDWLTDSVAGGGSVLVATNNTGSIAKLAVTDGTATGVVELSTLGKNNSGPIIRAETTGLTLHGKSRLTFCTRVLFPTLATSAQNYTARLGFGDSTTVAADTDGLFMQYSYASAYWVCVATKSGTPTTVTAATSPLVAHTWTTIAIDYDGTEAHFYAGGSYDTMTLLTSIATNLPTAANDTFGLMIRLNKTAGTTARTMEVDYVEMFGEFINNR